MTRYSPPEILSYAGGSVAVTSALTLTEVGVLVGIATALITLVINVIYMYRKDKREQLETAATLKSLEDSP